MKCIVLQNTIYKGSRLTAGASVEMPEAEAKQYASAHLVHVDEVTPVSSVETPAEAVKPPVKRAARKSPAKAATKKAVKS
ncbi:MAG: hypothetical protein ACI4RT_02240 [Candidatus Spyradenecus sp.]